MQATVQSKTIEWGIADCLRRVSCLLFVLACTGQSLWATVDANPRVDDVLGALQRVSDTPQQIPCHSAGFAVPSGGHLQGIQQATIAGETVMILSGSASGESYLALVSLTESTGRVSALKPLLARPFKHAGGFQVCGDYLAVGIEDDNTKETSKIWILKLPQLLGAARPRPIIEIERHGQYKRATAGAVGMTKVAGRHLVCVGTWDSATIDIYLSNGKALDDSACAFEFRETWDVKKADRSGWSDRGFASYQNINLVTDTSDRVFLVGFARTGGADVADVFELKLGASVPREKRLEKLQRCVLQGQETSFRHGAGLVATDAQALSILSCGYQKFVIERFQ